MIQRLINFLLYGRKGKKKHEEKVKRALSKINEEITWKKTGPGTVDEVQRVQTGKVVLDTCAYCGVQITMDNMFEDCPKRSPELGHTIFKAAGDKADG